MSSLICTGAACGNTVPVGLRVCPSRLKHIGFFQASLWYHFLEPFLLLISWLGGLLFMWLFKFEFDTHLWYSLWLIFTGECFSHFAERPGRVREGSLSTWANKWIFFIASPLTSGLALQKTQIQLSAWNFTWAYAFVPCSAWGLKLNTESLLSGPPTAFFPHFFSKYLEIFFPKNSAMHFFLMWYIFIQCF